MSDKDAERNLRSALEAVEWPSVYMFKFVVVKGGDEKIAELKELFSDKAEISIRESSGGKYKSFTAKELMLSAEGVMKRYSEIATVEGILSL